MKLLTELPKQSKNLKFLNSQRMKANLLRKRHIGQPLQARWIVGSFNFIEGNPTLKEEKRFKRNDTAQNYIWDQLVKGYSVYLIDLKTETLDNIELKE